MKCRKSHFYFIYEGFKIKLREQKGRVSGLCKFYLRLIQVQGYVAYNNKKYDRSTQNSKNQTKLTRLQCTCTTFSHMQTHQSLAITKAFGVFHQHAIYIGFSSFFSGRSN